jgi:magnesium transporter
MLNTCSPTGSPLWVDLLNPSDEEIAKVQSEWKVRIPSRAQLEEIESSSRLSVDNGWIRLSMPIIAHEDEEAATALGFILSKSVLITIRFTHIYGFDIALTRFKQRGEAKSSAEIFAALVEGMTDYIADSLEQIGVKLNGVSRRVFRNYGTGRQHNIARSNKALKEILVSVGVEGEKLSELREGLLALERMIPYTLDKGKDWVAGEIVERLKTALRDVQSLGDYEIHLSNKVQFLLDAVLGFINTEQNDIFKVLTIVSVVGIPPTFFASMWGMNFHNMPELSWPMGYGFALSVIALSTILPMAWFKWRGWW